MAVYRIGSNGDAVKQIQQALAAQGYNVGTIDGIFGGGTEASVRAFQTAKGLTADGVVGPNTWNALVGNTTPVASPPHLSGDLKLRCVALIGSFETSKPIPDSYAGLSGNFDGMGMSFGVLQWNLGKGTLQPLLKEMDQKNAAIIDSIFLDKAAELRRMLAMTSKSDQVNWVAALQTQRHNFVEPWQGYFKALGRTKEYQDIQMEAAQSYFNRALGYVRSFNLKSERAVALMFSICVQNGSISPEVQDEIRGDFKTIEAGNPADETPKLVAVANRRAEDATPRWIEDVRTRLLTLATGTGTVHGSHYDLAEDYNITMAAAGV